MSKRGSKSLLQINQAKSIKTGSFKRYDFKKSLFSEQDKEINFQFNIESLTTTELILFCRQKITELSFLINKPSRGERIKLVSKSKKELQKLAIILQSKIISTIKEKNEYQTYKNRTGL